MISDVEQRVTGNDTVPPSRESGVSALKGLLKRTTSDGWRSGSLWNGSLRSEVDFLSSACNLQKN